MLKRLLVFKAVAVAAVVVAISAVSQPVWAGTKTVMFGWEDGTSTATFNIGGNNLNPVFNTPDVGMGSLANVSTGSYRDYGPSGNPFPTPVDGVVTPKTGSRMLEVTLANLTADAGTDAFIYLGVITGLNPGDTYRYTMNAYDFSDDRSPSATQNATYAHVSPNINAFDGFAVRLQRFTLTTGWLEEQLDGNPPTTGSVPPASAIQPDVIFDPDGVLTTTQGSGSTSNNADAVRLEADLTYQSLTASVPGASEKFYIDDITISVTSSSPTATIWLPDGTSVLVNTPVGVVGDYNNNGVVDAADYVVWRNAGPTDTLPNDSTPGTVSSADYDVWKSRFGLTSGSGSGLSAGAVPEPAGIVLMLIGLAFVGTRRRAS
jgi:hypothetical protein